MLDSVSKAFYIGLTLQVEIIMKTMQTGVTITHSLQDA